MWILLSASAPKVRLLLSIVINHGVFYAGLPAMAGGVAFVFVLACLARDKYVPLVLRGYIQGECRLPGLTFLIRDGTLRVQTSDDELMTMMMQGEVVAASIHKDHCSYTTSTVLHTFTAVDDAGCMPRWLQSSTMHS